MVLAVFDDFLEFRDVGLDFGVGPLGVDYVLASWLGFGIGGVCCGFGWEEGGLYG